MQARERKVVVGITGSGKTFYVDRHIVRVEPKVAAFSLVPNFGVAWYTDAAKVPQGAAKWGVYSSRAGAKDAFARFVDRVERTRPPVVVVDEILVLIRRGCENELVELAVLARNWGSAFVPIGQRAYGIPLEMRSQCSEVISFQQILPHDIRQLGLWVGNPGFPPQCDKPAVDIHGKPVSCGWGSKRCIKHFQRGEFISARLRE